jgi:putative chitinase
MLIVTANQLREAAPSGNPTIIEAIASQSGRVFAKYHLDSLNRALGFLSTALEESGFRTLTENLNYSAQRAAEVWPSKFPTVASAAPFATNPQALANKVYGGRMGNVGGNDGYLYRGRGLIQCTGKDNYAYLQTVTGLQLLAAPDLLNEPANLLECSVALFVRYPHILDYCDKGDFPAVWALVGTGRANGPLINLPSHNDSLKRLRAAIPALANAPDAPPIAKAPPPAPIPLPVPKPAPPPAPAPPAPIPDAPAPISPPPAPMGFLARLWAWITGRAASPSV